MTIRRVYRAVGLGEYLDIVERGIFDSIPRSLEGKWFADSYESALLHGDGHYTPRGEVFLIVGKRSAEPSLARVVAWLPARI